MDSAPNAPERPTLRPEDVFAIGLLCGPAGFSDSGARAAHAEFLRGQAGELDFVNFLAERGVLSTAAPTLIQLMQAGSIKAVDEDRLLGRADPADPADPEAAARDRQCLDWILGLNGFQGVGRESVVNWWSQTALKAEGLIDFLIRKEVLTPLAGYVWDLHCLAGRAEPSAEQIVRDGGAARLRSAAVSQAAAPSANSAPKRTGIKAGMTIGRVQLQEKLADGQYGPIFQGLHGSLNVSVTVSFVRAKWLPRPDLVRRFRERAESLAKLNHPNVLRLWDFGFKPYAYLSAEQIDGPTLAELINQTGRLAPEKAVEAMTQILDGLTAAEKAGVGHGPFTAADIVLTHDGTAKLAGSCLSGLGDEWEGSGFPAGSFGEVFYHLLTGRSSGPLVPLGEIVTDIDTDLADLVHGLLSHKPGGGPDPVADLRKRLNEIQTRLSGGRPDAPRPESGRDDEHPSGANAAGRFSFWRVVNSVFARKGGDDRPAGRPAGTSVD